MNQSQQGNSTAGTQQLNKAERKVLIKAQRKAAKREKAGAAGAEPRLCVFRCSNCGQEFLQAMLHSFHCKATGWGLGFMVGFALRYTENAR